MKLAQVFDALERATQGRDLAAANRALETILGVRAGATDFPPPDDPPRVAMLRYDVPRRIDLLALRRGKRAVAKFEDLSLARATALSTTLEGEGLPAVRVGPYAKRFDVSIADDAAKGALYTVIAGRGTIAAEVAEAERDRSSAGTRRAGQLLGYPACCIERFVEVSQSAAADDEGINEATLRAFVGDGSVPWELNPLSVSSPIGFMPCSANCRPALAFAQRVLSAVDRDPVVERTLRRPILFFRFSAFFVLDGEPNAFSRAALNGVGPATTIERWTHHVVGRALGDARSVALDATALVMGAARIDLASRAVPLLLRFG
jgi:hypothetical protein